MPAFTPETVEQIDERLPRNTQESLRKQIVFLNLISQGYTIKGAVEKMGIHHRTYQQWRKVRPGFTAKVDAIKAQNKGAQVDTPYDGTFIHFRKLFLGFDTYLHQATIIHAIETAPKMGVTLILVPPEHGKTSVVEDYCTYKLANNPNFRITVVSEGTGHATKIIGRVRGRFEDPYQNPALHKQFGPFRPESDSTRPWTQSFFTVIKAKNDERDYSMEARGWKSNIAGTRTDLMIIDDMQSHKSLNLTETMLERLRQDILSRPGKDGRTIIVGTRAGETDIYNGMIESGLIDKLVVLPATDIDAGAVDCEELNCDCPDIPHEKPLCPEMWPIHALAKRRKQVTEPVWWRTYQQRPRAAHGSTFREEAIERCKNPLRVISRPLQGSGVIGVDPALGGGNAVTTAFIEPHRLTMVDVDRRFKLSRTEEILGCIQNAAMRYDPRVVIIEEVAFQRGLKNDQRLKEMGARYGFRIQGHYTQRNKMDDIIGVASMATSFEVGEVDIPWGDEHSKITFGDFCQELLTWRPDVATRFLRQDIVMSTWFIWSYWMDIRKQLAARDEPKFTYGGLPWSPTGLPKGA